MLTAIAVFLAGAGAGYAYGRGWFTFAGLAARARDLVARLRGKSQ